MTATIAAVQTARVALEARPALMVRGARGAHARSDFVLVRVITSEGIEGYGEVSATPLWSGEDGMSAEHFIRTILAPALIGKPLAPVGAAGNEMDQVLAANSFTKAGVATALWDAYARTQRVPLAVALGGPYRYDVPIKLSLSGDGPRLEQTYRAAVAAGFTAFKVKVGIEPEQDLARVQLARELAGPDAFVGADGNGGWSRADAARTIPRLRDLGVAFIEQPLPPDDLEGMRELRQLGLPIVADESVFGMSDLVSVIKEHAADVVSLYVGKSAGPGRLLQMGSLAIAHGIDVLIGSNGELGLGAASQLHVAAALPALSTFPSDIIGAHYYDSDVLAEPLPSDGTRVRLTEGAGLGVTLREDLLQEFR